MGIKIDIDCVFSYNHKEICSNEKFSKNLVNVVDLLKIEISTKEIVLESHRRCNVECNLERSWADFCSTMEMLGGS